MRSTSNSAAYGNEKISKEFASRISRLNPKETIHVVLLINSKPPKNQVRDVRSRRRAAVEANKRAAEQPLGNVDNILRRFGGQRLSSRPNALGAIVVETTPQGVLALSQSEHIRAILEDQPIKLLA